MENLLPFLQQHLLLSILFCALVIVIIIFEMIFGQKTAADTVTPQEAVQLINRQDAVIIDIRRRDAFVRGHIINAVHLPFADIAKDIKKIQEHKHKPIIVVCNQGIESAKAKKIIDDNDFPNVKILKGGLTAWRDDKLPLEKC